MKKTVAIILAILMTLGMLTLTACGNSADASGDSVKIESALAFYNDVWAAYGEDNKFACTGGDAEHSTEGPGEFAVTSENAETFKYLLHVTDELYAMLDNDAATLQHMMNTNTFSSAVVKLKDASKAGEFAEAYKEAVQGQQWMCGFPDKVVVISVGDYAVIAFGSEDNINNLVAACTAVESKSETLVDAPACLE